MSRTRTTNRLDPSKPRSRVVSNAEVSS
jgi:hypothetical protein